MRRKKFSRSKIRSANDASARPTASRAIAIRPGSPRRMAASKDSRARVNSPRTAPSARRKAGDRRPSTMDSPASCIMRSRLSALTRTARDSGAATAVAADAAGMSMVGIGRCTTASTRRGAAGGATTARVSGATGVAATGVAATGGAGGSTGAAATGAAGAAAGAAGAGAAAGSGVAVGAAESAMVSVLISLAFCVLHSGRSDSFCCEMRCSRSVPSSSWSMRPRVVRS